MTKETFLSLFYLFSAGLSEGELLSGVMFIHSSQTLGVSEVSCSFVSLLIEHSSVNSDLGEVFSKLTLRLHVTCYPGYMFLLRAVIDSLCCLTSVVIVQSDNFSTPNKTALFI